MSRQGINKVIKPSISKDAYVAKGVRILGDVEVAEGCSIWFNAVIRGDEGKIIIGPGTNVQDNAVIHSDMGTNVLIGRNVTIGHGAIVRSCVIGDNVMVGMNSTIMSHAEIGENSIIGANSFVAYNSKFPSGSSKFPSGSLILGSPARLVRKLGKDEIKANSLAISVYRDLVHKYKKGEILGLDDANFK